MSNTVSNPVQQAVSNGLPLIEAQKLMPSSVVECAPPDSRLQANSQNVPLLQIIDSNAAADPDALALRSDSESLTYRELTERAGRLAKKLRSLGVGPEVLVGICLPGSIAMVVAELATLKAGGAYVPLDPAYPAARLAFMLNDARVAVLLTQRCIAQRLPLGDWHVVDVDEAGTSDKSSQPIASDASPENLAYVIYTSGSTGQPKGVAIAHRSLMNLVSWHHRAFTITSFDRATLLASVGFDAAVWELWPYLAAGASLHLPGEETRMQPERLRDWIVQERITISFVPTPMAERLIALDWPDTTSLRILLTGGDTLHHFPRTQLPFELVNNYGPTENTVVATSGAVLPDKRTDARPAIGSPIDNVQVYILDENLRQVPVEIAGDIYIGGAGLARGYLNRPELTQEKFIPNPFSERPGDRLYSTGDVGRYLPNGEIAFLGRVDEQVKIRGYRIEPNEIATVLNTHPDVEASAVVAREVGPGERRLVAYLVCRHKCSVTDSALRVFLRTLLPDYMVPDTFVVLDSLPLTPNGKIDRASLPTPNERNTLKDESFLPPQTSVERKLAKMVSGLLEIKDVGVNDNFFLLGGHSLLGAQLIALVRKEIGVQLTLRTLFSKPTVRNLSAEIERQVALGQSEMQANVSRGDEA